VRRGKNCPGAQRQIAGALQNFEELTDAGPLPEVCSSSLAMRMLFEIYAPETIPLHIEMFQMYALCNFKQVRQRAASSW
jgi:hypothetical protein